MLHLVKKRHFTHTDSNASFLVIHPHSFNLLLPSRAKITQPGHSQLLCHMPHTCVGVLLILQKAAHLISFSPAFQVFIKITILLLDSQTKVSPSSFPRPLRVFPATPTPAALSRGPLPVLSLRCHLSSCPPSSFPAVLKGKNQFYSLLPT